MTKTIYWLCDLLSLVGGALFLTGIYLLWGLAIVLMAGGLLLLAYATRLSYSRFCIGINHDN